MRNLHIALALLAAFALCACGNKGPLVSAQKAVPVEDGMPPIVSPPPTDPADPAPVEEIAPPADEDPVPSTPG